MNVKWEQHKLGDIAKVTKLAGFEFTKYINYSSKGKILAIRGLNIKDGKFNLQDVKYIDNSDFNKLTRSKLRQDDILFTYVGTIGNSAIVPAGVKWYLAPNVCLIRTQTENAKFISHLIQSDKFQHQEIPKWITTSSQPALSMENIRKFSIILPTISEQLKISNLVSIIDTIITLQQRKLEQLKQLKKAMLQQLFVDKNSKQPNLRFKNFNGEWEQRKLGTVGKTQSGIGFPTKEQGGQKGVPFFKVSDMNNNGNEFEMTTSNNYVTEQQIISKKWKTITKVPAVIFAKVGAALMLNRKRLVTVPFLIDNNTMAYMFGKNWDPYFGKVLFDTLNLPKYAQTGALPSFNGSDIENIKVMFPTQVEQQIIGCFFESINGLITHQQNKLTQLTTLKKYLLQNLFI
ncbi:restriction endonuclease subunit S [Limosilactobacillus reuteri]|uniref:restriction endonuclease subunit S n=1 Tax=Limosilactobacillus reuteri TaxID=1598 RepID=UPI003990D605